MHARPLVFLVLVACGSKRAPEPPMPITETPASTSTNTTPVASAPASAPEPPKATNGEPEVSPTESADVPGANAFGWKILAQTGKATENALVSGASIRQALSPLLTGARGPTADEMARALALEASPSTVLAQERDRWDFARGRAEGGAPPGIELATANRLWVAKGFALLPDFTQKVSAMGVTAPESVDFGQPRTRETINAWVSEQTRAKIPELLPSGSLDARTKLVVTNAIWFKGRWSQPFPEGATKDAPFKGARTSNVPTMEVTDSFGFAESNGTKLVELRYANSQLAMVVVLPTAGKKPDLAAIESTALKTQRVHVSLPKFTFKSGGPMKDALASLGMKTAFTDRADFSGIADAKTAEKLSVGQVFHQTWIAVDERGTEAAAATGGTMHTTAMPMGPVAEFKADHPFWFAIRETKTGRILFAGRVTDPK